jgi:hypothetical protein
MLFDATYGAYLPIYWSISRYSFHKLEAVKGLGECISVLSYWAFKLEKAFIKYLAGGGALNLFRGKTSCYERTRSG